MVLCCRSDVNFSSGKYFGSEEKALELLPFCAGLEAVGVVAAVGEGVTNFAPGMPVGHMSYGEKPSSCLAKVAGVVSGTKSPRTRSHQHPEFVLSSRGPSY